MTEPHLSLDALADLLAAEGSDADEAHLSGCEGCAGRLDELAAAQLEVAAVLASLPAPPLPAGLADRLQAALDAVPPLAGDVPAAERPADPAADPAATGEGPRTPGATVTPFPHAQASRPRRWIPAAAAAAVLVLAVGTVAGTDLLRTGGGGDATTALQDSGGGSGPDPFGDLTRNETGTDYAADGTLAAALPALLAGSATPLTGALSSTGSAPAAEVPEEAAGSAAAPPAQARSQDAAVPQPGTPADPALDRLRTPEGLASCLSALLPAQEPDLRPLAVDYAAYAGEPALVVLLPATGGAPKVDVFVVGAGCAAGNDETLFFARLDRP